MKCPYCNSPFIYKLGFGGGYKCNNCNRGFDYPEYDNFESAIGCFAGIIIIIFLIALNIYAWTNY